MYYAKDFIETTEGLVFAVVEQGTEQGRVLCFLRYVKTACGWQKYSTNLANTLLKKKYPQYLFYSEFRDVHIHAVPIDKIYKHYPPGQQLQSILQHKPEDVVERDLLKLCELYQQHGLNMQQLGITGSVLISAQNNTSDIDLVIYGRAHFFHAREITRQLINSGQLQQLNDADWLSSYERRQCELSLEDYIWHEQRKFNKAMIGRRKFDISLINKEINPAPKKIQKYGKRVIQAHISDDAFAFDTPALFKIDHDQVAECVSYTATYTGQAVMGERVEISGTLEKSVQGVCRIVVGSSREATGEYIKVLSSNG